MQRTAANEVGRFVALVAIVASVASIVDAEAGQYTVEGRAANTKREWGDVLKRMDLLSDQVFKRSFKTETFYTPCFFHLQEAGVIAPTWRQAPREKLSQDCF